MVLTAGSNIGPYRIIEPIGRGGMASVFKAYEASLDRYVALKVLPPEFLHDPNFAARFRREAQTVARLEHPQIIPIFAYDIDAETGTPWMAMRLISGGSLSQRIKRGRLAPSESARILKDVADALDYAHAAGVIHRDVKPQNVLLDDAGRVYLADFGIAKMVEASAHMTQTGMITGTPQYMAPEQALGKPIDKSIDIYALGIVAYELFTGRVPFSADTPVAVLMKQASEPMPLPPVSEVREEVTRAILRATAKDPAARWPTATAFARALTTATTSVGSIAATSVLSPIVPATVPGMAAPGVSTTGVSATGQTVAGPTDVSVAPAKPSPAPRSGLAIAAIVITGLGLVAAATAFLGYRYFKSTPITEIVVPAPTPLVVPSAAPAAPGAAVVETAPKSETPPPPAGPSPSAAAVSGSSSAPSSPTLQDIREQLTPAQRRALMNPSPRNRQERLAAVAEVRRQLEAAAATPGKAPAALPEERAAPPVAQRAPRTRVNLEVEASQPSTGSQIGALFAQVLVDNRPYRDFTIRFMGANSFMRWKRVENIVLEDVPLSAKEITLVVATDAGLNSERMEGSTRLALQGEETSLSAVVRYYNQFDKSVRFR